MTENQNKTILHTKMQTIYMAMLYLNFFKKAELNGLLRLVNVMSIKLRVFILNLSMSCVSCVIR